MVIFREYSLFVLSLGLFFLLLPAGIINLGSMGSLLKMYAVIPIAIRLLSGKFKNNFLTSFKTQLVLTIWVSLTYLWSIDKDMSWNRITSQYMFVVLAFIVCTSDFQKKDILLLKRCLIGSSIISAIIVLLFGVKSDNRLLLSDSTFAEDPNLLCSYFLFGFIHALDTMAVKPIVFSRFIIKASEIVVYFFIVFSTGSRGGLLALIASLLVFLVQKNKISMKGLVLIFVLYLFFNIGLKLFVSEENKDRYTIENVQESGGTHRTEIWERAWDVYTDSSPFRQIFGYGYNTARSIFDINRYESRVMHNVFLEYLLECGLIGLIIYSISIGSFIKEAHKNNDYFSFSILLGFVCLSLSTNIIAFKPYWNIMLYSMCFTIYFRKETLLEKNNDINP